VRTLALPAIALTAQHGESEEKALDLGAHDFLTTPVQSRSLVAQGRAVLKRSNICGSNHLSAGGRTERGRATRAARRSLA
jgi:DNA-binding response OmpR family regulator